MNFGRFMFDIKTKHVHEFCNGLVHVEFPDGTQSQPGCRRFNIDPVIISENISRTRGKL